MRRSLLWLAAAAAALAVILAVSGGTRATVGGLRVSAQSPLPSAIAAALLALGWLGWARRDRRIAGDLEHTWQALDRHASKTIAGVAIASSVLAVVFATRSASGADASGYLSQAEMFAAARGGRGSELGLLLWAVDANGFLTTPLGWRPLGPDFQVPSYPPGLPMLMAIPHRLAGSTASALVAPLTAGVAVWSAGAIAAALSGGVAGVIAAAAVAVTPVFLFQSVQPMSDVPVTAAWLLCLWLLLRKNASAPAAGVFCALAVLIRPNLAPLAAVLLVQVIAVDRRKWWHFAAPVAASGFVVAFLQNLWYGSPLRSGYGGASELFALENVSRNASHYFGWLVDTSPVMLLAIAGLWMLRRRREAQVLAAFAALVVAAYLVYAVFDDWSYLRFLLPALAVAAIFVSACLGGLLNQAPVSMRFVIFVFFVLLLVAQGLSEARARDAFKLADQQRRVPQIARALTPRLKPTDVIIAGEQSGSMRYYTGHEIVRWDELKPPQWDQVLRILQEDSRAAWIVLDGFEEPLFRSKFGRSAGGALDWPPALEAGITHRTRAWSMNDRAGFVRGVPVPTDRIR